MSMTQWVAELVLPVSSQRDHILGPPGAPVTLVEYGDYECPHCGRAYPIVEAVRAQMGANLRFAFRHFPVTTVHPHAEQAAEAAEAAGVQGAFWPMHGMLFGNQQRLRTPDLHTYAEALGLDTGRFDAELLAGVHTPRVREDFMSGVRSGVNGTPTFFINGLRYDGSWDAPDLLAALISAVDRVAS
jgi:protein-disulfide isomerase